jgi:hypothetical protein
LDEKRKARYAALGIKVSSMTQEEADSLGILIHSGNPLGPSRQNTPDNQNQPDKENMRLHRLNEKLLKEKFKKTQSQQLESTFPKSKKNPKQ